MSLSSFNRWLSEIINKATIILRIGSVYRRRRRIFEVKWFLPQIPPSWFLPPMEVCVEWWCASNWWMSIISPLRSVTRKLTVLGTQKVEDSHLITIIIGLGLSISRGDFDGGNAVVSITGVSIKVSTLSKFYLFLGFLATTGFTPEEKLISEVINESMCVCLIALAFRGRKNPGGFH